MVEPAGSNGSLHSGIARYQGLKTTTELSRIVSLRLRCLGHQGIILSQRLELDLWIPCHAKTTCWTTEGNAFSPCNRVLPCQNTSKINLSHFKQSGNINSACNAAHQLTHSSSLLWNQEVSKANFPECINNVQVLALDSICNGVRVISYNRL